VLLTALLLIATACGDDGRDAIATAGAMSASREEDVRSSAPVANARVGDAAWHVLGDATAPVVVLQFSDFDCHHCARFARETWPRIRDEYVRGGRVQWRFITVARVGAGRAAALAAECAAAAGPRAFLIMHDRLFEQWRAWHGRSRTTALLRFARDAGMSDAEFARCLESHGAAERVDAAADHADRLGVIGSPTFFVNGVRIYGAQSYETFRSILDAALAR
jgi:protein-disulfide isomerase